MICPLCQSLNINPFFEKRDSKFGKKQYLKCPDCWLIFLQKECLPTLEDQKKTYDQHENSPAHQGYVDFLNKLVIPLALRLKPKAHGLDFGCGPGPTLSSILIKKGFLVEDYDPIYKPNQDLLSTRYDFVTCTEVIEHFHQPRKDFLLLNNLLTKRGYLGLMTQTLQSEDQFKDWWYHRDPTHVCFYQKATFEWIGSWLDWNIDFREGGVVIFRKQLRKW